MTQTEHIGPVIKFIVLSLNLKSQDMTNKRAIAIEKWAAAAWASAGPAPVGDAKESFSSLPHLTSSKSLSLTTLPTANSTSSTPVCLHHITYSPPQHLSVPKTPCLFAYLFKTFLPRLNVKSMETGTISAWFALLIQIPEQYLIIGRLLINICWIDAGIRKFELRFLCHILASCSCTHYLKPPPNP